MHSSFLQLGHLHIPIYGIFAAAGLMAALALGQWTARYANLAPEAVWDAGVTAILSAFVISRLLLIAFNFHSFLQYPLLVLALPSLTTLGILLTAFFMLVYIRWQKLPFLPLLDAVAPCAVLLWACLSLGRHLEGTRDGMPIFLHGNIHHTVSIHRVELYTVVAASLLCVALLRVLRSSRSAGQTASIGLISAGLAIFFLDFFRLPSNLLPNSPLDPSQIIGVAMILIGAAFLTPRCRSSIQRESGTEPPHAI